MSNQCSVHEESIKNIERKVNQIYDLLQGDLEKQGLISRVNRNEEHRKFNTKVNWMFFAAMVGLLFKAII